MCSHDDYCGFCHIRRRWTAYRQVHLPPLFKYHAYDVCTLSGEPRVIVLRVVG